MIDPISIRLHITKTGQTRNATSWLWWGPKRPVESEQYYHNVLAFLDCIRRQFGRGPRPSRTKTSISMASSRFPHRMHIHSAHHNGAKSVNEPKNSFICISIVFVRVHVLLRLHTLLNAALALFMRATRWCNRFERIEEVGYLFRPAKSPYDASTPATALHTVTRTGPIPNGRPTQSSFDESLFGSFASLLFGQSSTCDSEMVTWTYEASRSSWNRIGRTKIL